ILPLAGAVRAPAFEYVSACGVPTAVPSTVSCVDQVFAVAPLMKYRVAVWAAPSESYTVREVELLKLFASVGLKVASAGCVALAGRLAVIWAVEVACGALSLVVRDRSARPPVLKPPLASGGYTCRCSPWALTTLPSASSWNWPSRVYSSEPLSLMARSRLLPVVSMLPCANCWATSDTATPLPTAVALTPCWVEANRSANSAREPLKPTVATLARLFAVTESPSLAAFRPVRAMLNDIDRSPDEFVSECAAWSYMTATMELSGTMPLSVFTSTD